ncbi:MAG: trypsin-like peptidase domain-containing protein [Planctomycetaceae bacterium]|nr:trypsin-like peptidase domain-containing protein [Planctomycetaceae bacterium]
MHRTPGSLLAVSCAVVLSALVGDAAVGDIVKLKSGASIDGTVLKRTDRRVWVDVGSDVLSFSMDDVDSVESENASAKIETRLDTLFSTATGLAELPPREQAKNIGPAVIKVSTPGGLGSGVILSRDGYAITNAHVVQGETNLRATVWFAQPDGTLKRTDIDDVELVAINNQVDLALVKLKHPDGKDFVFAPVQDAEKLEIGQSVFAIGNPLGLERTLTQGVVSTTQRNFDGLTYIQTDTPINPGNSGGPLFNTKGEVIGITNMGILGGEALGFAIPARYVKDFIRNREAFAYDKNNPNSGHNYQKPPARTKAGPPPELQDGSGNAKK